MRARSILEAESTDQTAAKPGTGTLVIHMDDRSTDFLSPIYQGMGYPVITGPMDQAQAEEAIKQAGRVFMLGHGGPYGLFTRGFSVNENVGQLLAEKKDGLYIWCNADAYAVKNKLTGLCSGMFISEVGEAAMFGIRATQAEVNASNDTFSRIVREVYDAGHPYAAVRERYTSATCKITQFNSERLYVFDKGVPTPALHDTSAAHWCAAPQRSMFQREIELPQREYHGRHPGGLSDQELEEIYNQVGYFTSMMLDGQMEPAEAAEAIVRHVREGTYYREEIAGLLQRALAEDWPYEDAIEQILTTIFGDAF